MALRLIANPFYPSSTMARARCTKYHEATANSNSHTTVKRSLYPIEILRIRMQSVLNGDFNRNIMDKFDTQPRRAVPKGSGDGPRRLDKPFSNGTHCPSAQRYDDLIAQEAINMNMNGDDDSIKSMSTSASQSFDFDASHSKSMSSSSSMLPKLPPTPPRKNPFKSRNCSGTRLCQRKRLLVFIRIILKCLNDADPSLHIEVKQVITDCTKKNRDGVPGYQPLADAISSQLRIVIGEVHWNRAECLMAHYLRSHSHPRKQVIGSGPTKIKYAEV